ncbi:MAG TPA: cupredoxin family copper-binding protein [Solirubrobacterales bacterium]
MKIKALPALVPVFLLVVLAVIGVAGCGGSSDSSSSATGEHSITENETGSGTETGANAPAPSGDAVRSAEVEIEEFAYGPDPVTIEEGGKVTWKNRDSAPHTATAVDGSFDTGTIEEDKLKSETFKEPGTYEYVCSIHPQMHGTVEVVEAG